MPGGEWTAVGPQLSFPRRMQRAAHRWLEAGQPGRGQTQDKDTIHPGRNVGQGALWALLAYWSMLVLLQSCLLNPGPFFGMFVDRLNRYKEAI